MTYYPAGLRRSDMKCLPGFPAFLMFTFDDLSGYGDGEQKSMFRQLMGEKCRTPKSSAEKPSAGRAGSSPPSAS